MSPEDITKFEEHRKFHYSDKFYCKQLYEKEYSRSIVDNLISTNEFHILVLSKHWIYKNNYSVQPES